MLFHSYEFILLFLPITFAGFFILSHFHAGNAGKMWFIAASLFFYSWWDIAYLPLLLSSITFNFFIARQIKQCESETRTKKWLLLIGISSNLALLCYFKYMDFFIANSNEVFGTTFQLMDLALPLAISFFTLQQIAFLVDVYEGLTEEKSFLNYMLFVSFFPQLIAGPIVHHRELMPQFIKDENRFVNHRNIAIGLFIFSIGLFKKIVIASQFDTSLASLYASYSDGADILLLDAWLMSVGYYLQLYFDFSAYSDMVIGIGLMFNINLPTNFNSPLKATSIVDFWRRWHITLSNFIRSYLFTPLLRLYKKPSFNYALIVSFFAMLIMGIWHGAGWNYVLFGTMHALAVVVHTIWIKFRIKCHKYLGWFLTFNLVNLSLILVRAPTLDQAFSIMQGMVGGVNMSSFDQYTTDPMHAVFLATIVLLSIALVLYSSNAMELKDKFKPNIFFLCATVFLFLCPLFYSNDTTEFIYFQF